MRIYTAHCADELHYCILDDGRERRDTGIRKRPRMARDARAQNAGFGTGPGAGVSCTLTTGWLTIGQQLAKMTRARRENLDQGRLAELAAEDAAERVRLGDEQGAQHELHARISGTREWKEARGEAGA